MTEHPFETKQLSFGSALDLLVGGAYRVRRAGWNGKGMWLQLIRADQYGVQTSRVLDDTSVAVADVGEASLDTFEPAIDLLPWIGMKTADHKFVPWLASQADLLADDWELAE